MGSRKYDVIQKTCRSRPVGNIMTPHAPECREHECSFTNVSGNVTAPSSHVFLEFIGGPAFSPGPVMLCKSTS